jgi:hypothetical protein
MNLGVIWPVWEASVLTDVGCCGVSGAALCNSRSGALK